MMLGVCRGDGLDEFRWHLLGRYLGEKVAPHSRGEQTQHLLLGKIGAGKQHLVDALARGAFLQKFGQNIGVNNTGLLRGLY